MGWELECWANWLRKISPGLRDKSLVKACRIQRQDEILQCCCLCSAPWIHLATFPKSWGKSACKGAATREWQVWAETPFAFAFSLHSASSLCFAIFSTVLARAFAISAPAWIPKQVVLWDAEHSLLSARLWLRVVSSASASGSGCSIPKARWRSRRVVTQLARPLLSTGQNNYVLEWKPSLTAGQRWSRKWLQKISISGSGSDITKYFHFSRWI